MAQSNRKPKTNPVAAGIKVIASKSCPSLSTNSTITYQLGRDSSDALHIRLHENSGGGFFNDDWHSAQELADALRSVADEESVTSRALAPLFHGRSANTPAFFAAVLRNEGALLPYRNMARRHVVGDLNAFLKQTDPKKSAAQPATRAKPTPKKKKAPATRAKPTPKKKKAPARRKTKASPAK